MVSNDHGRTQKCDFCILVCKTNFIDHHTLHTLHGFRDSVLVYKMYDCMIRKNFEHFHSFHPGMQAIRWKQTTSKWFWTHLALHFIYLFKFYSILIILFLKNNLTNIYCKINKIVMNVWMFYICSMKSSGKYNTKRWEEAVNVLYTVDWNHQRSVIVVDDSRNFKGI